MKTKHVALAVFLTVATAFGSSCQPKKSNKTMEEKIILIETSLGNIKVKLYNETPQHRDNFVKLVNEGFYDGLIFHRVIKDFMVQGGDPQSRNPQPGRQYGSGGPDYTVPAEFNTAFIHKKGALSAARTGDQVNPEKRSSGSQFYIVQGKKISDTELNQMEVNVSQQPLQAMFNKIVAEKAQTLTAQGKEVNYDELTNEARQQVMAKWETMEKFKYTPEQREAYKTVGGTPFLDGGYTVFGETIEGLDVIDKIAAVETAPGDRPVQDVMILKMTVVK
jgi:cyclophilin family peptidyl-prolyl cis-trans isomerase